MVTFLIFYSLIFELLKKVEKQQISFEGKAQVTSLISGGRRRLHYIFPDKSEKVEEYDLTTHEIQGVFENGKKLVTFMIRNGCLKLENRQCQQGIPVNSYYQQVPKMHLNFRFNNNFVQPIFLRKDTSSEFQFRIRNLPYPKEVYSIVVEKNQIVIRTSNKKCFKKIDIPDLQKYGTELDESKLGWSYNNNTLIVSYKKPEKLLEEQKQIKVMFQKMNEKKPKEGDIECVQK